MGGVILKYKFAQNRIGGYPRRLRLQIPVVVCEALEWDRGDTLEWYLCEDEKGPYIELRKLEIPEDVKEFIDEIKGVYDDEKKD